MTEAVLAILNQPSLDADPHDPSADTFTFANPIEEHLQILDLGATRGDGMFETLTVTDGRPQALEAHLARFARSAAIMDLPTPDLDGWRRAIEAVIAELDPVDDAFVKTVMTRGVEGSGRPTGWAYAAPAPDVSEVRANGLAVVTLDRGYRHDVARTSPWLLQGAKTLSYAVNMSAVREAKRRGADDAVWVSTDGYVLEGSTSSLVLAKDGRLITPRTDIGILEGTTQADIFRFAEERGIQTSYELVTVSEFLAADALWLVSSLRLAGPIKSIDGEPRDSDHELTDAMNAFLLARES